MPVAVLTTIVCVRLLALLVPSRARPSGAIISLYCLWLDHNSFVYLVIYLSVCLGIAVMNRMADYSPLICQGNSNWLQINTLKSNVLFVDLLLLLFVDMILKNYLDCNNVKQQTSRLIFSRLICHIEPSSVHFLWQMSLENMSLLVC